jgi:PAS domain S-box-containing protein
MEAAAFAAERFLKQNGWQSCMDDVLSRLGTAAEAGRVYLFVNNYGDEGVVRTSQRHEWVTPGIVPQIDNPELQDCAFSEIGFQRWVDVLGDGRVLTGLVNELPEAEAAFLRAQDVQAIVVVPIFVEGVWWGFIGFDECQRQRCWSEAEIDALRIAANTLGAAIERSLQEQALRMLNETLEQRVEERTRSLAEAHRQQREQRQRLRAIFENAAVGMALCTPERDFLEYSRDELLRMNAEAIDHPTDRIATADLIQRLQTSEQGDVSAEKRCQRSDGTYIYASVSLSGIYDEDERLEYFVAVVKDISERKAAQQALQTANEQLEKRVRKQTAQVRKLASDLTLAEQKERRRVAQILHDDLQQQLYSLQMLTEILDHSYAGGDAATMQDCMARLGDMLDNAIVTTRQLTVDISPPVLKGEGLSEALSWLALQMEEMHGLRVTVEEPTDTLHVAEDMRVLLFQLVRELLFNVVKHAGTTRATVRLFESQDYLVIEVADDGVGFDVEALQQPLGYAQSFGLFSVRERLHLFDGDFHIDTCSGEGTCCTIRVPRYSL